MGGLGAKEAQKQGMVAIRGSRSAHSLMPSMAVGSGPFPGHIPASGNINKNKSVYIVSMGFPGGSGVKNLPANAGDTRDAASIPGSGRSPGEGNGNPLQYSWLENLRDRRALRATVYGVAKNRTRLRD